MLLPGLRSRVETLPNLITALWGFTGSEATLYVVQCTVQWSNQGLLRYCMLTRIPLVHITRCASENVSRWKEDKKCQLEKKHECPYFFKGFATKNAASRCAKSHGVEKLYKCRFCSKMYLHRSDRNFHEKKHTKVFSVLRLWKNVLGKDRSG